MGLGLAGVALIAVVMLAFATLMLHVAVRCVAGFWPASWRSLLVVLAWSAVSMPVGGVLGAGASLFVEDLENIRGAALVALAAVSLGLQVLLVAGAVFLIVRKPDGAAMTPRRALGVAATYAGLWVALWGLGYAAFAWR
jgi:hypothetical protein